jgi:hypothetical protein
MEIRDGTPSLSRRGRRILRGVPILRRVLIALATLAAPVLAAAASTPVKVHLDEEGPGVSQAREARRLLDLFRKELSDSKLLSLVAESDDAEVRLVVREAEVFYEPKAGQIKAKTEVYRSPTTKRRQFELDADQEIAATVDAGREPVLVVRLLEGDTFVDFTNHASDRTLKAAARAVAADVERWLKRHRQR